MPECTFISVDLPAPFSADQRVIISAPHFQTHVVQRFNTGEFLCNVPHFREYDPT
jgi:hypothetical protein